VARLRTKSLVKQNLKLWLEDKFLRDGLYIDVELDQPDIYGNNLSQLMSSDNRVELFLLSPA
jgi:hypothetical protein